MAVKTTVPADPPFPWSLGYRARLALALHPESSTVVAAGASSDEIPLSPLEGEFELQHVLTPEGTLLPVDLVIDRTTTDGRWRSNG